MKKVLISIVAMFLFFCMLPLAGNAYYCKAENQSNVNQDLQNLEIKAKACVLMDKKSGRVLVSMNKDTKLPMASMTKMMVLDIVMDQIDTGRLGINHEIMVSDFAASMGGSQCFLDAGKNYSIYELIKSVVVASANDSTVALAEAVSGSEKVFVEKMNLRAKELGMNNTHFVNSTGLDEAGHVSTAHDMAIMMREVSKHELLSDLSKVWMYDMKHSGGRVTKLTNTNRLIKSNPDVVFAKTGHTDDAGFCITAYATRDGEELIACVMGESTSPLRFLDCTKLLSFGFTNFENRSVVDKNKVVGEASVSGANIKEVELYPTEDFYYLLKNGEDFSVASEIKMTRDVVAPIESQEIVGELVVTVNGENYSIPLEIREQIPEIKFSDIVKKLMK